MSVFKRNSGKDFVETRVPEAPKQAQRENRVSRGTLIGPKLSVNGHVRASEQVRVLGRVTGNMNVSGTVVIESGGVVTANIKAEEIVIRGKVHGDIECLRANIESGGELLGDVASPRMMLADGAVFKGKIDMSPKDDSSLESEKAESASAPEKS